MDWLSYNRVAGQWFWNGVAGEVPGRLEVGNRRLIVRLEDVLVLPSLAVPLGFRLRMSPLTNLGPRGLPSDDWQFHCSVRPQCRIPTFLGKWDSPQVLSKGTGFR